MAWDYFTGLIDANLYFTVERLVTTAWDARSDAQKQKAVNFAYNRMFYDPDYSLPTMAAATPAELVILRKATGEMAYYVAQHLDDEDRRKGIQVQGTLKAGIVQEEYDADMLDDLPVPPFVAVLLKPFDKNKGGYIINLDRDEDKSVDEDVTGF